MRSNLLDRLFEDNVQSLNQLCSGLKMSRLTVTKHLKILESANLVSVTWRGREKLHYLNLVPLAERVQRWVGRFEGGRLKMLIDLKNETEVKKENGNAV